MLLVYRYATTSKKYDKHPQLSVRKDNHTFMQLSFAPVTSRQESLSTLRVITDDSIMPLCAGQEAVQSKLADHRWTCPFAEQV